MKTLRNKNKVTVRINSRGGDVFAAQAIFTHLKTLKAKVEIIIEGIAASAATIITCAGDTVKISPGSAFMIHNPSITVWDSFEAKDLEQLKEMLDSVKNCIIETYCTKTTLSKLELADMMDAETWLTGREAVEKGFCDELLEDTKVTNNILNNRMVLVNNVAHDLSGFKNMPVFEPVNIKQEPQDNQIGNAPANLTKENQNEGSSTMTLEEIKANHPQLVEQIKNEAKQEERERIKAIENISATIGKELVAKAKFEEPMDAKELAFQALQNQQQNASQFLTNLNEDAKNSGGDNVTAECKELDPEEQIKEKVSALSNALNKDKRRVK
nr:head maturation protease, ClpP-related [Holtiella tumoricola]